MMRALGRISGMAVATLILSALLLSPPSRAVELPDPAVDVPPSSGGNQTVVLAGGCFWGIQGIFERMRGVTAATAGYSGGPAEAAHYQMVSSGTTGHAESVEVAYDPAHVSFGQILKVFFAVAHDPTELDRQGPDDGTQYRSVIFFATPEQQKTAASYIAQLQAAKAFARPIVTEIVPLKAFYAAEDYHQHYLDHHPDSMYIVINDLPKIANFEKQFPTLYAGK